MQHNILMTKPLAFPLEKFEKHFNVYRLWESNDPSKLLEKIGSNIKGVASSGPDLIDERFMKLMPKLEIVSHFGVGYDVVDVEAARRNGIIVTNTPDVLNDEVADLALGLLISTIRKITVADRFVREGRWKHESFELTASLQGRKVGIVGLGRIGKAVARRCEAFNLSVAYHGRTEQPSVSYRFYGNLVDLAKEVDILLLCTPGTPETNGLVNREVLKALGVNGVLVNVARGSVVVEKDLVRCLQEGHILGAGLDVFENEPHVPQALLTLDNVVLLPHVGSASVQTRQAMGQRVLDNLVQWFSNHSPISPVPETPLPALK